MALTRTNSGFLRRGLLAGMVAVGAFRRTFDDPTTLDQPQVTSGLAGVDYATRYAMLWQWYHNIAFENAQQWSLYKQENRLYRYTRSLYNPVRRLVDFYAGAVYPGVLTTDARKLPDGVPLALPLPDDTPDELRVAIGQWWTWTNFQSLKSIIVRYGALAGSVLVEIVDDPARGKVVAQVRWPALVSQIVLDASGNVKAYALQYRARDAQTGELYVYRKEVDTDSFRTFRDDEPWAYNDTPAVTPNPYGFVPAVWIKHTDIGGDHGLTVVRCLSKMDEVNSIVAHAHDQLHKVIASPMVFWSEGNVGSLFAQPAGTTARAQDAPVPDQESLLMLKGPSGGKVEHLAGNLDLGGALAYVKLLLEEIEADHPELGMYRALRDFSQITGPAAERLMGDVSTMVYESQANYDLQVIKLHQMAVAIAGWRVNRGDWGQPRQLNRQQQKFRDFDLDSYTRGDLDFEIAPRPLVPMTALERLAAERAQIELEYDRRLSDEGLRPGTAVAPPEGFRLSRPQGDRKPATPRQLSGRNGAATAQGTTGRVQGGRTNQPLPGTPQAPGGATALNRTPEGERRG